METDDVRLVVADVETAVQFYVSGLNLNLVERETGGTVKLETETGFIRLVPGTPESVEGLCLGISEPVDDVVAELAAKGISGKVVDWSDQRAIVVSDAFGNTILLCEPKRMDDVFADIVRRGHWGKEETVCGTGSRLSQTEIIRSELPRLIQRLGAQVLLDAPCGDCNWIKHVDLGRCVYIGVDVVPELIAQNCSAKWPNKEFYELDITEDPIPRADLMLCRDCLVHLPFVRIFSALRCLVDSGSTYLLATTFPGATNFDIPVGCWRPICLQSPPFSLPPPLELLVEQHPEYPDKSLGLWRLSDVDRVLPS